MSEPKPKSDVEVISMIKGSEKERREALQYFFKNPKLRLSVHKYVMMHGGNEADAKDVFTESFIIFERQIRNDHFRGESSLETYFHAIAKWQWLAIQRKMKKNVQIEDVKEGFSDITPEQILLSEERKVILQQMVSLIGERCQNLLGWFQLNYSMREIKDKMGYSSDQVAANQVHDCREKLKKVIEQHPENLKALKYGYN